MTSHGEGSDVHVVPPWTSAVEAAPEDDTSAPVLWTTLSAKLEEAADLGSRIKVREMEASVLEPGAVTDEVSREVLLKTCSSLKTYFKKLSQKASDERFEQLCARVVANASTSDAGLSASSEHKQQQRLIVPTGKKPLDLFDHTVWTLSLIHI